MDEVFNNCAKYSGLHSLKDFQRDCIENLICGHDVFVCCKTGSGKSACFETYPTAWRMFPSNRHSGVIVLIIEPLISIMSQSVDKMRVAGWHATYIGRDYNEDDGILNGHYEYVFASAESVLSLEKWRNMLTSDTYRQFALLIVIDEAHTIVDWFVII